MLRLPTVVTCALLALAGGARAQQHTGRTSTLRGLIVDTSLVPVPGALIYLSSAGTFSVSDDTGWFTLSDIVARTDTLHVRGRGFMPRSFTMSVPALIDDTIDVGLITLAPGPPPTLTLTVTAYDTLRGQPVVAADVLVDDRVIGKTDTAGVFSVAELSVNWGINVVLIRRLGYAPLFGTFWVGELNAQEALSGIMQPQAVNLPQVMVEADRIRFSFDGMGGFWGRQEQGWGRSFTREDIERHRPSRVTDLLRTLPNLSIVRIGPTTRILSTWSGQQCEPSLWLNGARMFNWDVDALARPQDIAAIEVYRAIDVPAEFSGFDSCGAIVLWTR